jgi:hypothetical protein
MKVKPACVRQAQRVPKLGDIHKEAQRNSTVCYINGTNCSIDLPSASAAVVGVPAKVKCAETETERRND